MMVKLRTPSALLLAIPLAPTLVGCPGPDPDPEELQPLEGSEWEYTIQHRTNYKPGHHAGLVLNDGPTRVSLHGKFRVGAVVEEGRKYTLESLGGIGGEALAIQREDEYNGIHCTGAQAGGSLANLYGLRGDYFFQNKETPSYGEITDLTDGRKIIPRHLLQFTFFRPPESPPNPMLFTFSCTRDDDGQTGEYTGVGILPAPMIRLEGRDGTAVKIYDTAETITTLSVTLKCVASCEPPIPEEDDRCNPDTFRQQCEAGRANLTAFCSTLNDWMVVYTAPGASAPVHTCQSGSSCEAEIERSENAGDDPWAGVTDNLSGSCSGQAADFACETECYGW